MRLPLDLIAAFMAIFVVETELKAGYAPLFGWDWNGLEIPVWVAFWLITWLLNEWVTRRTEWKIRFGHRAIPEPGRRHPIEMHGHAILVVQAISVALFAFALYALRWPNQMRHWPILLGLPDDAKIGQLRLSDSGIVATGLNLAPFLIAVLLSWLPRRRLLSGTRRRQIPLRKFFDFEVRLSWFPLAAGLCLGIIGDLIKMLPHKYTDWTADPSVEMLSMVAMAAIGIPLLMINLWRCTPLPEGELRTRLESLLQRSGVKVRKILVWGPRDTGLLNACVLGPWSRFRYVLISPALVDELSMEETEAVLAHEIGHARYGHLTLFLVMILFLSFLMDPIMHRLPAAWSESPLIEAGVAFAIIALYVRLLFGAVMRHCEREADLASAELVGSPLPIIVALEKLALKSGNTRNVYSWHHGSIADRVESVLKLSSDPDGIRRVHARSRWVRWIFVALALAALGLQQVL